MMRSLLVVAAALLCTIASARASENIRNAQAKLKEAGVYFAEVNGEANSDFATALTRYQIRNGLQITGTLNAETSKRLGVQPEGNGPGEAAGAETWRRLRKSNAGSSASASSSAVLEPIGDGKVKLKRERLRDYVAAFVLAGLDPQVGAELEFFADRVQYYNDGMVSREKIRSDLARYGARWPQRRFWLAGEVEMRMEPDSRIRVSFPLRYDLANGAKRKTGKVRKTLWLEVQGEDLAIVGVDEKKA